MLILPTILVSIAAQNGVLMKKIDISLKLLGPVFTMNVLKVYWDDAVLTAAYLINLMRLRTLIFKCMSKFTPSSNCSVIPPEVFGYICFVHMYIGVKSIPEP